MNSIFHFDVLPEEQLNLFEMLSNEEWIKPFYLVGGTSLALQIGHRQSIDFDFFIDKDFTNREIINKLIELGDFELFNEAENTINGLLNSVNISFLKYEYPAVRKLLRYKNILIADMFDIALMKLSAISGRGSKKDFIDLFFLLDYYSLEEIFKEYKNKFGLEISNNYHLLKSLVYFEDAEQQPMPKMIKKIEWDDVKNRLVDEVKRLMK